MFRVVCPHCSRVHSFPDIYAETVVRCPSCRHTFNADPLRPKPRDIIRAQPPPPPAPPPAAPSQPHRVLTAPHTCSQCHLPIAWPQNLRRRTLPCPHCGQRTSTFSVLHRCPACDHRLESPLGRTGDEVFCPRCLSTSRVPADLLLPDRAVPTVKVVISIRCPRCESRLLAPAEAVGDWAVCPKCEGPFHVPAIGDVVPEHLHHDDVTSHCRHCHLVIPKRSHRCPFCDANDPVDASAGDL
jgi:hypothetical protein